jgi:hypothetical protein
VYQGVFWKGERQFIVWVFPEFGGDGWRILRTMSEFVAVRKKLIAELEQVESVEFPVVSAWSAFGSNETGKPKRTIQHTTDLGSLHTAQCAPHCANC